MPGCRPRLIVLGLVALTLVAVPTTGRAAQFPYRQDGGTPASGPCAPASPGMTPDATPVVGSAVDYPFDLVFVDAMLFNHEASVTMAEIARQSSERPEILGIADGIIATQVGDITQFRA